jgi:hypothetical protein
LSKRLIALLVGAMALAMVAAGCGSDSDDDSSTASLTKAQFVKQGNAICAAGNKKMEAQFETFAKEHDLSEDKPPSDAQFAELADDVLVPGVTAQVEGLRELPAPSGEEDQVDEILSAAEGAIEETEDDPSAMADDKRDPFAQANKLANAYGLTSCGEG